jgi:hypothetical protein
MKFPDSVENDADLQALVAMVNATEVTSLMLQKLLNLTGSAPPETEHGLRTLLRETTARYSARLTPQYHAVPWGDLIVERDDFADVYKRTSELVADFSALTPQKVSSVIQQYPRSLMVFRLIVGYTWNELADIVYSKLGTGIGSGKIKQFETADSLESIPGAGLKKKCDLLGEALVHIVDGTLMPLPKELDSEEWRSRQFKVDTVDGWSSVSECVNGGVSFVDLLYERYTGRPFAYVRDALSEKKGDILEDALEKLLLQHGVPYERIQDNNMPGFKQAADFALPDRHDPEVIVEAKLCEDGGTARDKASRIERLKAPCEKRGILLAALVDGKGFRRFDDVLMPIVQNTSGHTYFLENIEEMLNIPYIVSKL